MKRAGVILKTVERCNINCTYCYYFNKADQSWRNRRPYISEEIIDKFNDFISRGVNDLGITDLLVEFHGGEPLMQKKHSFVQMCTKIHSKAQQLNLDSIQFVLQTNGILIDTEWIKIFKEYGIGVGISLDGTKNLNDTYRLDKKGNGTYDRVVNKIRLCQENDYEFGLLSV
ncbi:radical SAM protein [Wolbachia endosymbiont of Pentidionis agamae]|uniref:radical SAM protein n=1 Tax=Wolbachia endosymbiont of Pentidionis agamae TaxID=3110435 RepID=UPI002FD5B1F4